MKMKGRFRFLSAVRPRWLILLLFLVLLGIRFVHLGADPPVYLSPSGGLFGDESALAHNARNKVLFGKWISDDWNPFIYNPILSLLEYLSFSLLGVGLRQLRLVNVIAVGLSFFLLWPVLKKGSGRRVALLAVLLLGFNYIFIMYNRLGLNDTFLVLPMILTLSLWHRGLHRPAVLFLAGMSSFACYITKASSLFFVLATLFALIFAQIQKFAAEKRIRTLIGPPALYLGGVGLSYLLWHVLFFLPLRAEFAKISDRWFDLAMPTRLSRLWSNLASLTFPRYLTNTALELTIVWLFLPLLIFGLLRWWKKVRPMEIYALLWLGGGYVALNGLSYRPLRYFVPLIPAFALLCAFALDRIWEFAEQGPRRWSRGQLVWLLFLGPAEILWAMILFRRLVHPVRFLKIGGSVLGLTILILSLWLVRRKIREKEFSVDRKTALRVFLQSAVVSVVAFSLYLNGSFYLKWFKDPKYTVIETSKDLGKILDNAYIAGLWSPLATIENRHRALYVGRNWFNFESTFERYPVTHLFLWDGNDKEELRFFQSAYPQVMERAELIKIYFIKAKPVRLYKIR